MAMDTTKFTLPENVVTDVINGAASTSTIAALSAATPQTFVNTNHIIFRPQAEAEVVGERGAKSSFDYDLPVVPAIIKKVQVTTRMSDEFVWADTDAQTQIVENITADQQAATARALDYMVYHAVSPKTGTVVAGLTPLSAGAHQVTAGNDASADLDNLVEQVNVEHNVTGLALSPTEANALRKIRVANTGARLYDIPMNLQPGTVDGVTTAVSTTVNGLKASTPTGVLAFIGDYNLIRWGMVRDITAEMIQYGDPDGGGDLKHTNEVAYRSEAVFAFAVLDPTAFAVLKSAPAGGQSLTGKKAA